MWFGCSNKEERECDERACKLKEAQDAYGPGKANGRLQADEDDGKESAPWRNAILLAFRASHPTRMSVGNEFAIFVPRLAPLVTIPIARLRLLENKVFTKAMLGT